MIISPLIRVIHPVFKLTNPFKNGDQILKANASFIA